MSANTIPSEHFFFFFCSERVLWQWTATECHKNQTTQQILMVEVGVRHAKWLPLSRGGDTNRPGCDSRCYRMYGAYSQVKYGYDEHVLHCH